MKGAPTRLAAAAALTLVATGVTAGQSVTAPYGHAVPGEADRSVVIDDATRSIRVKRLETVELKTDDKSVTWTFDTLGTRPFPLSVILPGTEGVTVYVEESQLYRGT